MHSPHAIGPYTLQEELGRGAMGVVFAAVGPDGEPVAIKTVRGARSSHLEAMNREIAALQRLDHPGIARILDHGLHGGRPWIAMQRVFGEPLPLFTERVTGLSTTAMSHAGTWDDTDDEIEILEALSTAERPRAAGGQLRRVLTLARSLCETLAWLHGEGVVHRDLKPSNILVVGEARPVLLDFGLAATYAQGGRERLERLQRRAGTVAYMAPEQIRAQRVDARTDLYALGCVLFELVSGRPPFTGASRSTVLDRHMTTSPPRLAALVEGVPDELDDLVAGLLAKRPADRIPYADVVARVLEDLGAEPPSDPGPAARPYLYRGRFVGRGEDLGRADRRLQGGIAMLVGPSGAGKTRLAQELAHKWSGTHRIHLAECLPAGHPEAFEPLYPFRKLIREAAASLERRPDLLEGAAAPMGPFFQHDAVADDSLPDDPTRLSRAFTAMISRMADDQHTLVIVDDLQWADRVTLDWLEWVARVRPPSVSVLGACRAEEVGPSLQAVFAAAPENVVSLTALDADALGSIVGDMLAVPEAPSALVGGLADLAAGNPFFVAEYLYTAVAEGALTRDRHGGWEVRAGLAELNLPRSLRAVVDRRLQALGNAARHAASVLSAIGREASAPLLAALDVPAAAIAELEAARVVEIDVSSVRFVHDKLRESAYAQLDDRTRRTLHAQIAELLEAEGAAASDVALQYERAGLPERAQVRWFEAGRAAEARHALRDAAALFGAGLALGLTEDRGRVEARIARARALHRTGDVARAGQRIQSAISRARELDLPDLEVQALQVMAAIRTSSGDLGASGRAWTAAFDLARKHGLHTEVLRCRIGLGDTHRKAGEHEVARNALYTEGLANLTDPELAWLHRIAVARLALDARELDEARTLFEGAADQAREAGSPYRLASALNGLANTHAIAGNLDAAIAAYDEALRCDEVCGNREGSAVRLANIALIEFRRGKIAEAIGRHQRAADIFREVGNHRLYGHALSLLSRYARVIGDLDGAMDRAETALAHFEGVGEVAWQALALVEWAQVCLERRQTGVVRRRVADHLDRIEEAGVALAGPRLYELYAEALILDAEYERALAWLDQHPTTAREQVAERRALRARALLGLGDAEGAARALGTALPEALGDHPFHARAIRAWNRVRAQVDAARGPSLATPSG